jgi:hypothetical protein
VALARLPAGVSELLCASAENVIAGAAELGSLVAHGGTRPVEMVAERRVESSRITGALLSAIRESRRTGPDRGRLADVARQLDGVAEAIEKTAWSWSRHPIPAVAGVPPAIRDATRAAARAVMALEDDDGRTVWERHCREREAEAAYLARAARHSLFVEQHDAMLALAGQDVLIHADAWLAAVTRLRVAVVRFGLD